MFFAIEDPDVAEVLSVRCELLDGIAAAVKTIGSGAAEKMGITPELLDELVSTSTPIDRFTTDDLIGFGRAVGVRVHVSSAG